jgi:hypothetical protein
MLVKFDAGTRRIDARTHASDAHPLSTSLNVSNLTRTSGFLSAGENREPPVNYFIAQLMCVIIDKNLYEILY